MNIQKIVYIIKKGLQVYPPCLSQVLYLDDVGIRIVVYHGKNTSFINKELDRRCIEHYEIKSDNENKGKAERIINFQKVSNEINYIIRYNYSQECLIWFGNVETAIAARPSILVSKKYAISVLELYEEGLYIEKRLKAIINNASFLIACEPHRAEIMRVRYKLNKTPYVIPNKPYNVDLDEIASQEANKAINTINQYDRSLKIIYQGVIQKNRPLEQIASALKKIDREDLLLVVMGKCTDVYRSELRQIYSNTIFIDYIPAPEHLFITRMCNIGVANYDYSILNTIFCAPNKIYEYSKYGIPILSSDNIGLRETVGKAKAGVCVDFLNPDLICEGLQEIIENYKKYSDNAVGFYNSENTKERIEEIVNKEMILRGDQIE